MPSDISASLVLYNSPADLFRPAIESYLRGCEGDLWVIDNSPQPLCDTVLDHPRVHYRFQNANLGFGRGHNQALREIGRQSRLHLILNPDVEFEPNVLPALANIMEANTGIAAAMPEVRFPDGRPQYLAKLLPTPTTLFLRRFLPWAKLREHVNRRYELRSLPADRLSEVPVLSGCFLLIRTEVVQNIGGFDENFFMYMEDVDLVRRIGDVGATVFVPSVYINHGYGAGSYRNTRLLRFHLQSALHYFRKWGWWRDSVRTARNRRAVTAGFC